MQTKQRNLRQIILAIVKDLKLFSSLCIAQFIVWRTLRSMRREEAVRLELLKLVH